MKTVIYQGHTIKSFPQQARNSVHWTISLSVFWNQDGVPTIRSFTVDTAYSTEIEADLHGVAYAQRIIDGKVPGVSLT